MVGFGGLLPGLTYVYLEAEQAASSVFGFFLFFNKWIVICAEFSLRKKMCPKLIGTGGNEG